MNTNIEKSQAYIKLSKLSAQFGWDAEMPLEYFAENYGKSENAILDILVSVNSSLERANKADTDEFMNLLASVHEEKAKPKTKTKPDEEVRPEKELTEDERNEAIELLFDPELLYTLNTDLGRRIVSDEKLRLTVLLTGLSAYGQNPLNLFLRGPSSSGKTFVVTETLKYFPKKDIWFLGRLSPTALMHGYGETEIIDGVPFKVIDMSQKILVFLESPNIETITQLLPILSHDVPEIEIRVTNKNGKGQNKTENVLVRGAPVTIFCTTGGEILKDLSTRSLITAPEITKEKIEGVLKRQREEATSPWLKNKISPKFIPIVQRSLELLRNRYKNVEVFIPDFEVLEMEARMDPRIQRDQKKLFELIKSSARLHAIHRQYKESENGEDRWIEANYFDVITGLTVFRDAEISTTSGLPPFVIDFFRKVCVPLRDDQNQHTFSYVDMQRKYYEVYGDPLGIATLRLERVKPLENAGYLTSTTDELDRRTRLFQILQSIPGEKTREEYGGFVVSTILEEERLNKWISEVEKIGRIKENISRDFLDIYTGSNTDVLITKNTPTLQNTNSLYADANMRWYFLKVFPVSKEGLNNALPFKRESTVILNSLKRDPEMPSIDEGKNAEEVISKNTTILHNSEQNETPNTSEGSTPSKPVAKSNTIPPSSPVPAPSEEKPNYRPPKDERVGTPIADMFPNCETVPPKTKCESCGRTITTTECEGKWLCDVCISDNPLFLEEGETQKTPEVVK